MINKSTLMLEKLILTLGKKIPFLGMNPLNEASQRSIFLKKRNYNPVFRYQKHKDYGRSIIEQIESLKIQESPVNTLLMQKLEKFIKNKNLLLAIGTENYTQISIDIFGKPSQSLVKKAYSIVEKDTEPSEGNGIDTNKVMQEIRRVLDFFGLQDWRVCKKKMAANASVCTSMKKVYIKENSSFQPDFLKRIIAHEIGTHVFRGANRGNQPYQLFRTGLPNYLMTEEGLAVNVEKINGCLNTNTLKNYAGRVIAVHLSLQIGFRDVFNELKKYFPEKDAWKTTMRAKRGLIDTSKPGAYTKDYLYLHGFYEVGRYLRKHGVKGLSDLYIGRIGLEHIDLVKKIPDLKKPRLIPNSDKFRKVLEEMITVD